MTVQTDTLYVDGTGNDVATVFSFSPIVISEADDLVVTKVAADGTETTLSRGSSSTTYSVSVSEYPATGSITYPASGGTPLATGERVRMRRVLDLLQETNLRNQGPYNASTLEQALDRLVWYDQQQQEQIDRAVKIPVSGTADDLDTLADALIALNDIVADVSAVAGIAADVTAVAAVAADVTTVVGVAADVTAVAAVAADVTTAADNIAAIVAAPTEASNAASSASAASTSASNASTSASNAATSETNAALSAAKLKGTSTTSLAIAVASKTFTTQSGKQFNVGQFVLAASDAAPATNWMFGQITSYSGTSLTVDVTTTGGSGTYADWTIYVAGARGATGAAGQTGGLAVATAGGTVDAITADYSPNVTIAAGLVIAVISAGTNTSTTPTLAVDGGTARTITKFGGQALVAGDIPAADGVALFGWDATNTRWELLNPVTNGAPSYATGSWTPVLAGSSTAGTQTYSTQVGRYVKIGDLVWFTGAIALSAKDGTTAGDMRITGLPFAALSLTGASPACAIQNFSNITLNTAGGYSFPIAYVQQGQSYIGLSECGNNVAAAALTAADFGNTSALTVTGVYRV